MTRHSAWVDNGRVMGIRASEMDETQLRELIADLGQKLARMNPNSPEAREARIDLTNAEQFLQDKISKRRPPDPDDIIFEPDK
jgi:hypothetical protein